jgi:hypothetical protein
MVSIDVTLTQLGNSKCHLPSRLKYKRDGLVMNISNYWIRLGQVRSEMASGPYSRGATTLWLEYTCGVDAMCNRIALAMGLT